MPVPYFPVSVLQNGLKLTTEPPKGLKANLKLSYHEMTEESFSIKEKEAEWRKLLFGLCFFHAVVQERRKFGPLGFNIRYEFNESDLSTSITMLRSFLTDTEDIPWDAMRYMMGHINYGGRVTDDQDRVLVLSLLEKFFSSNTLKPSEEYQFSESGIYYVPDFSTLQEFRNYLDTLPPTEAPDIFGLNSNASIITSEWESNELVRNLVEIQPRVASTDGAVDEEELALGLTDQLPALLDMNECAKDLFKVNHAGLLHCHSTVLKQEIQRYN